jgi:hypothetical protein
MDQSAKYFAFNVGVRLKFLGCLVVFLRMEALRPFCIIYLSHLSEPPVGW